MEYELSISKEILLGIKPLKNEFRKEDLNLKRLSINIIKGLIIILITVLMIIFLLEILYKKSLTFDEFISVIFASTSFFLIIPVIIFLYNLFSIKSMFLRKFAYLINRFTLKLINGKLIFKSENLTLNLDLKTSNITKYKDILILDDKGFKVVVPLNEIKFGQILEKEILEVISGESRLL